MWLAIVGISGAIAAVEYRRYMSFWDTLSIKTKGLKLTKSGQFINVNVQVIINNKTSKNVNIDEFSGSLFSGSLKIGDFKINQKVNISANTETTIPLTVLINPVNLLKNAANYIATSEITLKTNTKLKFELLGIVSIPVVIKDTTIYNASELIAQLRSTFIALKSIFKK